MSTTSGLLTHTAAGAIGAMIAALATWALMSGTSNPIAPSQAHAQAPQAPATPAQGQRTKDVIVQPLGDIGREMRIRLTERDPGNGSTPHRHPGHHTFGYVLEGTYELRVDDGLVRQLKAGDAFYEPPGSLHAVSRNPSPDKVVRYLVIQVADPAKPGTVPE